MRTKRREKRRDRDLKGIVQPTSPAKALWLQTKAGRRDGIEDVMTYAMALAYGGLEAMLQPLASQGTYTDWAERHSERPSTAIAPTHCGQLPGSDPAWHRSTETTIKIPTSKALILEEIAMERSNIWGYCDACDVPLLDGLKLNLMPCPEHPDHMVAYCDDCVREAEARVKAPNSR